jgi:hypothetical protein
MIGAETPEPEPDQDSASKHEEAEANPIPEAPADDSSGTPPRKRRLRRPTVFEASAFVAMVGGIVGLVFVFAPGCEPKPPPDAVKATISDVRVIRPVTFKRFLQRQNLPLGGLTPEYLARRGLVVEFHYGIVGLSGKPLKLGWEVSEKVTNELVASKLSSYELTPSKNEDSGVWPLWIPAPKPGRKYYATVTIYKPEGPPYELVHFPTAPFPGFAAT